MDQMLGCTDPVDIADSLDRYDVGIRTFMGGGPIGSATVPESKKVGAAGVPSAVASAAVRRYSTVVGLQLIDFAPGRILFAS
jgi:hypothetical protein